MDGCPWASTWVFGLRHGVLYASWVHFKVLLPTCDVEGTLQRHVAALTEVPCVPGSVAKRE
eukprot:4978882-Amphidinium_carterae.1